MKISIPKPCHEDWNKMTPNAQGAFCRSCCKTVVDFTSKTTEQITDFFEAMRGQKVCGRFRREQLQPVPVRVPGQRRLSRFLCALYVVFGALLFTSCGMENDDVVGKVAPHRDSILGDSIPVSKDTLGKVHLQGVGDSSCVKRDPNIIMGGPMAER